MVNALKRMDKKFLIMAGIIICLPLFLIIFLAIIQGCGNNKITHEKYEEKMISALQNYAKDTDKLPKDEGETLTVELSTLVNKEYIKSTEDLLDDTTCEGSVSVRRNGASIETNNGGFLSYTVDLNCKAYSTVHLADKITEEIVTEGDGLYKENESYIFKGKKVNNYITFFGHNYRIMSIDKDGILKLVKIEPEMPERIWDNKFNIETNRATGKNIYKDSVMVDYLLNDYSNTKKISTKAKEYVVAYDVCVGKRNSTNLAIDSTLDCSEKLEKQLVSLINVSDYAKASLDPDCSGLRSPSCNNYNYLYGIVSSSWTLNATLDNTYEVILLSDGMMELINANTYNAYNLVIYIDGNHLYKTGTGSSNDPYIITSEK